MRRVGWLAVAPILLLPAACSEPRPDGRTHVVLVLVDQLRKDAADRWLDRVNDLAAEGIVFDNARSVAPWTYPSVISLMSGLYPQQHGADGSLDSNVLSTFSEEVPLLQQALQRASWRTAAFVTNPFLQDWNPFHRGFDHFDASFVNSQGNRRGLAELVWRPETMFADTVNRAVKDHYRDLPLQASEFTYVHYIDVHGPWEGAPFSGKYKNAVRWVDERIVELYRFFDRRYRGRMLFLVTSDHGRALGDDERLGHGPPWRKNKASLHDFNLLVPLLILPGEPIARPRRISAAVSNVDVAPTLLDWLGLEPELPLPGRSLLPAIRGTGDLADRPLYSRMSAFGTLNDAMVLGERKYMRFFDPATGNELQRRVFDLAADPDETASLGISVLRRRSHHPPGPESQSLRADRGSGWN